jgi:hypothetical protein
MSLDNEDRNPETLQHYNHPSLDVAFCRPGLPNSVATPSLDCTVRISLPEIRVRSRIAVIFEADNPNDQPNVDLRELGNTVTGYQCIKTRSLVAKIGELWGKNAIPLQFPKSNIAGICLETAADTPWIDINMHLGNPQIAGRWSVYYHAGSDNKLKKAEWERYITQVTAEVLGGSGVLTFPPGG